MSSLTEEVVFAALEAERSGVQFPIVLNDVWEETGYLRRDNAVRRLKKSRLIEGIDFLSAQSGGAYRGKDLDEYFLTVDAFKSLCLSANTDKGEETRRYFIGVEKKYRSQLEHLLLVAPDSTSELERLRQENLQLKTRNAFLEDENQRLLAQVFQHEDRVRIIAGMIDDTLFDYTFEDAIRVTQHVNHYDTKTRILSYLEEGTDYLIIGKTFWFCNPAYYAFVVSSRTKRSLSLADMKDYVFLRWDFYQRVSKASKSSVNAQYPN